MTYKPPRESSKIFITRVNNRFTTGSHSMLPIYHFTTKHELWY